MRSLATILALGALAVAAPDARAQAPAPPPPSAPAPPSAGQAGDDGYITGDDEAFEPERRRPSIALGPAGHGNVVASLDLGWLRSGLRADVGLGAWLDLVIRADALLLYTGFGGQNGIYAGLRASPVSRGPLRAGVEVVVGQVLAPGELSVANLTAIRASGTVGVVLDWATFYGRGDLRWLSNLEQGNAGWSRDAELGAGVERGFGRFVVGAEGYLWSRGELSSLGQWRVRAGVTL